MLERSPNRTELPVEAIEPLARQLADTQKNWHFHILTKDCALNRSNSYELIIENAGSEEVFLLRCNEKPMALGQKLAKLLHGEDIVGASETDKKAECSPDALNIISTAKELTATGIFWHHHMLFPDCIFNMHRGHWTLVLEDPESKDLLEYVSTHEPTTELKIIETLFYSQKI